MNLVTNESESHWKFPVLTLSAVCYNPPRSVSASLGQKIQLSNKDLPTK